MDAQEIEISSLASNETHLSHGLCSDDLFVVYELKDPFSVLTNDISPKVLCFTLCVSAQRGSADRSERPHRHSAADPQSTDHPHGAGHGNDCVSLFSVLIIMLADLFG